MAPPLQVEAKDVGPGGRLGEVDEEGSILREPALRHNVPVTRYESLEHTADTGVIAFGSTREELFENAAYGLFDLMYGLESLAPEEGRTRRVTVEADGPEELLVAWLGELLFLSESEERAWCRFSIDRLVDDRLEARVAGAPFSEVELAGPPVKAITYHDLEVAETDEGWRARVVFDV